MKAVKNSTFDSGVLGSQVSFAVLSVARIAKKVVFLAKSRKYWHKKRKESCQIQYLVFVVCSFLVSFGPSSGVF